MILQLFYSPTSPFVRKVLVAAHELGIADQIETLPSAAHPVTRDQTVGAVNPLAKVPTALTPQGVHLFDSRVICEYLDSVAGRKLFPSEESSRWQALTYQALGDGLLDAAVLVRYEMSVRPAAYRWLPWEQAQMVKIAAGLAHLERTAPEWASPLTIGTLAVACAIGYLDFRFQDLAWRADYPRVAKWFAAFCARPSITATAPRDP